MTFHEAKDWAYRNRNVLFFVGGFLFDALTLVRIDSILDLLYQSAYLGLITFILIKQYRLDLGQWQPSGRFARFWHYETEAIHFCYGGLLSAYVILYFKSTTGPRSMVFLLLTLLLMFANEMPKIKEAGSKMRLGLHAFCLVSYLNYVVPIIFGRMGWWTFALAVLLTGAGTYYLVRYLARMTPESKRGAAFALGWPPVLALALVTALYIMKWIPPVPLSMQFGNIYHRVERINGQYQLSSPKPPWYFFWRRDSRMFLARQGDVVYCFVRVFAPRRFTHQIYMVWAKENPNGKGYYVADRLALPITGGRGEGYRGVGAKSNYEMGKWRVSIETEDARTIGAVNFEIKPDPKSSERTWRRRVM